MDYRFGSLIRTVLSLFADANKRLPSPLELFPWTPKPEPILLTPDETERAFDLIVGA